MTKIRVCGVPEHFNEVWQIAIEKNMFIEEGIDIEWISVREGTGAMINKLKLNETDVIVALTEGLIGEISSESGNNICLIGTYVQSSLLWSISTSIDSHFNSIEDLKGKKFGISRYKSGSHLMSCVLASQYGWKQSDIEFIIENNFDNLRDSINQHRTDAFMWEYFMQKPFYDKKQMKQIGEIITPWPCFLIASTKRYLDQNLNSIEKMFVVLQKSSEYFRLNSTESIDRISLKYNLKKDDATQWFNKVNINPQRSITQSTIETTIDALQTVHILKDTNSIQPIQYLDTRIAKLIIDIKSMRLYNKPELLIALRNNLRVHGLAKGSIQYTDLLPFDQNHYFGTQILDLAVQKLNLTNEKNSSQWIIQIGSNLAGCARYLAGKYHLNVLAIELQNDLSQAAQELTERCHLSDKIHHLNGDFLTVSQHLRENSYHSIVSWLTLLHFDLKQRIQLLKQSYRLIQPNGFFYFEDFYQKSQLTNQQSQILEHDVFCQYLPDFNEYQSMIENQHFKILSIEDLTQQWKDFTKQRLDSFQENKENLIEIHGQDIYSRLEYFYRAIVTLFQQDSIGGIRILAKKI